MEINEQAIRKIIREEIEDLEFLRSSIIRIVNQYGSLGLTQRELYNKVQDRLVDYKRGNMAGPEDKEIFKQMVRSLGEEGKVIFKGDKIHYPSSGHATGKLGSDFDNSKPPWWKKMLGMGE
tara:strand:- start:200 stop:562 length:363 start_codon:yes stop_codon:yes gene_type:complete